MICHWFMMFDLSKRINFRCLSIAKEPEAVGYHFPTGRTLGWSCTGQSGAVDDDVFEGLVASESPDHSGFFRRDAMGIHGKTKLSRAYPQTILRHHWIANLARVNHLKHAAKPWGKPFGKLCAFHGGVFHSYVNVYRRIVSGSLVSSGFYSSYILLSFQKLSQFL